MLRNDATLQILEPFSLFVTSVIDIVLIDGHLVAEA